MSDPSQHDAAPDADLVQRTVRGDARAFEQLTARYYRPVGGFLYKRVQRPDVVEDLTQETFLQAFRTIRVGRLPERFSSWLFGIAHNVCGKWLRRRPLLTATGPPPEELAAPDARAALEEAEEQKHLLARLDVGLANLPHETRELLRMKHRDGRTCEQIAADLGRPVGTVKSLLSRAYKELRGVLAPEMV